MKDKKFESRRKSAIRQLASGSITDWRRMTNGVYLPHCYDEVRTKLGYWDDFGFRLNRQWVSVAWVHPRMRLLDHLEDVAGDMAEAVAPYNHRDFFNDLTPNYKTVGNSRKVKVSSTWNPNPDNEAYFQAYKAFRLAVLKGEHGMDFSVPTTEFKVEQMSYGRFVSITSPVELIDAESILDYAPKVKAHLKGEYDLLAGHPETYSLADYHRDLADVGEEIR